MHGGSVWSGTEARVRACVQDVEDALYTQANALGITIITISQRPGLTGHHDQHVRLIDGAGRWDIADMH